MSGDEFLERVWGIHDSGQTYVAWKDWKGDGSWHQEVFDPSREYTADDLYFCPHVFDGSRRKDDALPTRWLHADLDESDPTAIEKFKPTIAWQTSSGRYQALWQVSTPIKPKLHAQLNARLTTYTGADAGGWSITKVLRVPGTINNKRKKPERVKLLWDDGPKYTLSQVVKKLRHVPATPAPDNPVSELVLPNLTATQILAQRKLPSQIKRRITSAKATGDRSKVLWKLENELLEHGVPPEEVYILVQASPYNKYKGQRREQAQLWREIQRAASRQVTRADEPKPTLKPERNGKVRGTMVKEFLARPLDPPSWLVDSFWSKEAHGIIAGEAKTYKSLIATDLAVAVASGSKFLGHFEVPENGPVIIIQEENDPGLMQDRVMRMMASRGLGAEASLTEDGGFRMRGWADLPIRMLNNEGFKLTEDEDMHDLELMIKADRPSLVVLDPFYLMAPGLDENSAQSVGSVLEPLLRLKQEYDCGIMLVHHYRKQNMQNPTSGGPRISGSSVFHRWFESAIYIERGEGFGEVVLTGEHRGHAAPNRVMLGIDLGSGADLDYRIDVEVQREAQSPKKALIAAVTEDPGMTLQELAVMFEMKTDAVRRLAGRAGCPVRVMPSEGKSGRPPMGVFPPTE